MAERESLVYRAKLAEQAERYTDMVKCMKTVAEYGDDLSVEERNLLSVAYKNVIGSKRASWRVLSSIDEKSNEDDSVLKEFLSSVERELGETCSEVIQLLDDHLIKNVDGKTGEDQVEALVFYQKMKGDYLRYIAEYKRDDGEAKKLPEVAYDKAYQMAEEYLPSTHPIKLGLALNFSVFHYEISGDKKKACELAKKAFDTAIAELDELKEDTYKDSTLIMQLLRDNLTLWTSEADDTQLEDVEVGGE